MLACAFLLLAGWFYLHSMPSIAVMTPIILPWTWKKTEERKTIKARRVQR